MTGAILKISPEKNIELRYTARRAEKLEALTDDSLLNGLAKCDRAGTLVKFISCGADIPQEEAYDIYDEFVANGGTTDTAAGVIFEALVNGGFISKNAAETAKKLQGQLSRIAPQS